MANIIADIHRRLDSTIGDFFAAHSGTPNEDALSLFTSQWQGLYNMTAENGDLDEQIASLAYGVADTMENICHALLDLDVSDEKFSKRYETDVKDIVDRRKVAAVKACSFDGPHTTSSYVEPAYCWLSENLHNPYPAREVRNKICRETNTPRKDLDNWFTNARRRIGWTSLLKHFGGDRDRMIEAATTYFRDRTEPWDNRYSPISIAFTDMASTLKDLYANKFEQSTLGRKLDGAVKNMTPELQVQEQANKKRREEQREAERRAKKERMERAKEAEAQRAYPSPDRSPRRSPDSSLPSEATPTQKRRSSDDEADNSHRSKRRSRTNDNDDAVTSLPSPFSTDTEGSDPSRQSTPSPSKRKRRLSDSDGAGTFKRHCGIHGSRRSVSDPSSSTSSTKTDSRPVELYVPPDLEGWFETALAEFPPDPEVDVFNYSAMSPSSQYSDDASSAGPSTPRSSTPVELPADTIAPSLTVLNNGSILDSISKPEFSISGLDLEGLLPTAVPGASLSSPHPSIYSHLSCLQLRNSLLSPTLTTCPIWMPSWELSPSTTPPSLPQTLPKSTLAPLCQLGSLPRTGIRNFELLRILFSLLYLSFYHCILISLHCCHIAILFSRCTSFCYSCCIATC
ncbi:mating-type protein [Guyanagaster necrorhizus]|uniref:Mating-type protein n=1 Tax=Guyanagaster necrorhizus TaxID=856835 RepID=A0A9P7W480_9AGAR|nr:mating-type protein [Guyanagaster necrorhizus MCA 3950]KAG7452342.1 mating-type protein [Guyanagaster necrorhizus MCA 3950]